MPTDQEAKHFHPSKGEGTRPKPRVCDRCGEEYDQEPKFPDSLVCKGCRRHIKSKKLGPSPTMICGVPRSPQWPALEKQFLKENPSCSGCGTTKNLQAHHKLPYHEHPELELSKTNLMTVCFQCHLVICHLGNWLFYNPACTGDARKYKRKVDRAKKRLEDAKREAA